MFKILLLLGSVALTQGLPDWPTMEPDAYARLEATAAANYVEGNYIPYKYQASTPPAPPSPTPSPLEKMYSALLNKTCGAVLPHVPVLPAGDADNFMKAYKAFNGANSEADVIKYADMLLSRPDVKAFTGRADSFGQGGLDADLVLCTVLTTATPAQLANFSGQGKDQARLVDTLLEDTMLMRDMLVAGGAQHVGGDGNTLDMPHHYGEAMSIYTQIAKASTVLSLKSRATPPTPWDDRTQTREAVLHRLAIGVAVEQALPINYRMTQTVTPPWGPNTDGSITTIDPVQRYMDYESAYLAGFLDPAFEVLTALEMRHVANSDAVAEDLAWLRDTMLNYNPALIAGESLNGWRYTRAVREDVSYGDPMCATHPGLCDGHYTLIPAMDGVCGYRAFFGRFVRNAHGIPTWGFAEHGHGAMTTWSPAGWIVNLGAGWPFGWSGQRTGPDFHVEMLARELRPAFQTVLRGTWAASARGDTCAGQRFGDGVGDLWSVLMLYSKKAIVANAVFTNGTSSIPVRPIGPSAVPTRIAALIAKWPTPAPTPTVTTDARGTITIPAALYSPALTKGSVSVMNSGDNNGDQLMHHGGSLFNHNTSSLGYEFSVENAGTYYLTANHTTWHVDQDLMLAVNGKKADNVPVYFTIGYWNETQSVEVDLVKGNNTLVFTRYSTTQTTFKEFFLYKIKPTIPAPPANYTPAPITPPPAKDAFILEDPNTSCLKQGISEVPEEYCSEACTIFGFTSTGPKSRPTPPGCFVMTSGPYKGNCNFNLNASATCDNPPCTLYGAVVQNLCVRK